MIRRVFPMAANADQGSARFVALTVKECQGKSALPSGRENFTLTTTTFVNNIGRNAVNITSSSIVTWGDSPLGTAVDGQFVLMDMNGGKFFGLDDIATDVWRRIERPIAVSDLCAGCVADFAGDPQVIEADILRLLETLADHGLVLIVE